MEVTNKLIKISILVQILFGTGIAATYRQYAPNIRVKKS
jgi:hypothetical protein